MPGPANTLLDLLHREAARRPLTFRAFMELALYHPTWGYYCRGDIRMGREGDFITAPHQSAWFGRLLAKQLHECWEHLGRPGRFEVVEFGPGAGWLVRDVLETVEGRWPALREALRYSLVEVSAPLREAQGRLLDDLLRRGASLRWLAPEEWEGILKGEGWEGVALAHEFLDALPVHRVRLEGGKLRELYVHSRGGELTEGTGELSDGRLAEYFARAGVSLEEGQVAEVNLAALDWVARVTGALARGYLLIFDYGSSAASLYAPERAGGTLVCCRRHRAHSDPYAHPGEDDMSAHVDFSSLLREGEERALAFAGFTDLARFLLSLGLAEELGRGSLRVGLRRAQASRGPTPRRHGRIRVGGPTPGRWTDSESVDRLREVLQVKPLLLDAGPGGTIKALALARDAPGGLTGFSQKPADRASWATLRAQTNRPPAGGEEAAPSP